MPARRKCGPSRWSRPTPSRPSTTSAPTSSQTFAISLMKLMRVDEERVRRELDHLRRGDVACARLGASSAAWSASTRSPSSSSNAPIDDPVGLHEVGDRAALREELRVRDVADVREAARVERGAHVLARADRHRALHHDDRLPVEHRELVDDGPDGARGRRRRSTSAACRRRRRGTPRRRPPRARRA